MGIRNVEKDQRVRLEREGEEANEKSAHGRQRAGTSGGGVDRRSAVAAVTALIVAAISGLGGLCRILTSISWGGI